MGGHDGSEYAAGTGLDREYEAAVKMRRER
jgi:hypothetical protein